MKTLLYIAVWRHKVAAILTAAAVFLPAGNHTAFAQCEENLPRESYLFSNGIIAPAAPEALAMTTYGSINGCDLYSGAVGTSIPVYTYQDNDFTLPLSLSYHSNGFKPNLQSGVLGLDWSLNAGGAITREVRGIMDDAWPDLELYHFKHRRYGDSSLDEVPSVSVYGYGFLHDLSAVNTEQIDTYSEYDYADEYVYQGKAGAEYLPVFEYQGPMHSHTGCMFEKEPDVFHFSVPGHSGSFILKPGGGYQFYGTSSPAKEYHLNVTLNREGFTSFVITDGSLYRYVFGQIDRNANWSESGMTDDIAINGSWRLTRIEAPDGRYVALSYGEDNRTQSIVPVVVHEVNHRVTRNQSDNGELSSDSEDGGSYKTHGVTQSSCLTQMQVRNADGMAVCTIAFQYSPKAIERGLDVQTLPYKKLDAITITNADGRIVRTCNLSYALDNGRDSYDPSARGVTFLRSVSIPGEGTHSFEYKGRNNTLFPDLGTYQTDWYGYWNSSVTQATYLPSMAYADANASSRIWLTVGYRQPSPTDAQKGMLEKITWPTGGWTTFAYESNSYTSDRTGMTSQQAGTASGMRVSCIRTFDQDGSEVQRKDYSYVKEDGTTGSGRLLWRPELYGQYNAQSTGFLYIHRKVFASMEDFSYSGKAFLEYPRMLETAYTPGSTERSITEYKFYDVEDGERDMYSSASAPEFSDGWYYRVTSSNLNISSVVACLNNCLPTALAGTLKEKAEYSNSMNNQVLRQTYIYSEFCDDPALSAERMVMGYEYTFNANHMTPTLSNIRERMYGNPDHTTIVSDKMMSYSYDNLWRIISSSTTDSEGNALETRLAYHSDVPALPVQRTLYRSNLMVAGEQFTYAQPSAISHPLWYAPYQIKMAAIDASGSATWNTVATYSGYNAAGNPTVVTDAMGNITNYTWDSTLLNLTSMTQYPSGPGSPGLTTSWTWIPLVGVASQALPSGKVQTYEYDNYGRLVRGSENGITLSRFAYNIITDNL